ncbi:gamma-glutamylcyclotransferase [Pelomonas sp. P8]|uniref:glutathione-specific gamma-glutamylcyclotransferase n=2 Tax=Pelomonas cellulosilytica TaxID=2906762 RepID=A0ABS8XX42_9BURK|nr:gamma-glutamylcyclotransferase [Pelomonas sp. P8]MCE4555828.1 gamma-glutamylcyclotransferase [Pelomonas sp. P8]
MASLAIPIPHGPARSAHLLQRTAREWRDGGEDLLLFAYGSLIWRPEFEYAEALHARVLGYHRVLRMRSSVNRGSPQQPGLVLALVSGGSCRGLVYRIPRNAGEETLERLWAREMPNGVYEPRWLNCMTETGEPRRLRALAFTLSRQSPHWTGTLHEPELLHIFRHAQGRYGTTLDYLLRTVQGLREQGIRDKELERQAHLAAQHGLCAPL